MEQSSVAVQVELRLIKKYDISLASFLSLTFWFFKRFDRFVIKKLYALDSSIKSMTTLSKSTSSIACY
jgi:hypothetical protein